MNLFSFLFMIFRIKIPISAILYETGKCKLGVVYTSEKIKPALTENDIMKFEIAEELGLMEKVNYSGWKSLSAKESGRIGGIMAKRKKEKKNEVQKQ